MDLRPEDPVELRDVVEAETGRLNDDLWDMFLDSESRDRFDAGELTLDELVLYVKGLLVRPSSRQMTSTKIEGALSERTIARSRVLEKLYAQMATSDYQVVEFRDRIDRPSGGAMAFVRWVNAYSERETKGGSEEPLGTLAYDIDGRVTSIPVFEVGDGILAHLVDVVDRLAKRYPWTPAKIARWVVAGTPPPKIINASIEFRPSGIPFVKDGIEFGRDSDTDTMTRVILTVDPAMDPEDVDALFRMARRSISPKRFRPLEGRALGLANFLLDDRYSDPVVDGWERRLSEWNAQYPRWAYQGEGAKHAFKRGAQMALQRLAHVGWTIDGEPTKEQERER